MSKSRDLAVMTLGFQFVSNRLLRGWRWRFVVVWVRAMWTGRVRKLAHVRPRIFMWSLPRLPRSLGWQRWNGWCIRTIALTHVCDSSFSHSSDGAGRASTLVAGSAARARREIDD